MRSSNISLDTDPRLQRSITISATDITLGDLLQRFSTSGLILTADGNCTQQSLQIHLSHRRLSELMRSLAGLIPGFWEPRDNRAGYLFIMSPSAVVKRRRWWDLFLGERERAKEAQRQKVLDAMRTPSKPQKSYQNGVESAEVEEQDQRYKRFFLDLPADLKSLIAEQMVDVALNLGYHGSGIDEGAVTVPFEEMPPELQDTLHSALSGFFAAHPMPTSELAVRFNNFGTDISVSVTWPAEVATDSFQAADTPIRLNIEWAPDATLLPLNHAELSRAVKKLGRQAPRELSELAAYQDSRFWPDKPPKFSPISLTQKRRADALNWLADKGAMEYVADYYSDSGSVLKDSEKQASLPHDLEEELNELAQVQDLSWRRNSAGIYLVRNNRWYRDDELSIPREQLEQFWKQLKAISDPHFVIGKEMSLESKKARLDWEALVVSQLTQWQIATSFCAAAFDERSDSSSLDAQDGHGIVHPFEAVARQILEEFGSIRFYAGLNDDERSALFAHHLPISSLTADQQQQLCFLFPTLRSYRGPQLIFLGLLFRPTPVFYMGDHGSEAPSGHAYFTISYR
jgi:hypothetical protein